MRGRLANMPQEALNCRRLGDKSDNMHRLAALGAEERDVSDAARLASHVQARCADWPRHREACAGGHRRTQRGIRREHTLIPMPVTARGRGEPRLWVQ